MATFEFVTVDVFTDRRFGGNPLAVFPAAAGMSDADMQAVAKEFNLSETTFVLPPESARNTARVRIFNTQSEMAFAGHPNVGTAFVLASGRADCPTTMTFEQLAGLVAVELDRTTDGVLRGATITAPEHLTVGRVFPVNAVAACVGLDEHDIIVARHPPILASAGRAFVLAEVTEEALTKAAPDSAAFRRALESHPTPDKRFALLLHAASGSDVRTRMFAPLAGISEDAATGAAHLALAAFLLSLGDKSSLAYHAIQGVEMGRRSLLDLTVCRERSGIMAKVGGPCVSVFRGEVTL